jgi:hypothetical protein
VRATALWLAIVLALAAILSHPLAVHAVPAKPAASLIVQASGGSFLLFRIWDQPCPKETLQALGTENGEHVRRASVVFGDKAVDACWHTDLSDGNVTIFSVTLNRYDVPLKLFRPERKA